MSDSTRTHSKRGKRAKRTASDEAARASAREGGAPGGRAGAFLQDDEALAAIERKHADGITAGQIVDLFTDAGVRLSEATFRKWVQLGLLPRSRRVGRKGKHQGSLGLYPPQAVRLIATIRRQMAAGFTVEDIARSRRLRDGIEALERAAGDLFRNFSEQLAAQTALSAGDRQAAVRQLEQLEKQATALFQRVGALERRIVAPLEREARARAFGSGTSGGAGELL